MGFVGFLGLLLSLAAMPMASATRQPKRVLLFLGLLAAHLLSTVVYYLYVQTASADTGLYYFDGKVLSTYKFAFGTVFTGNLVWFLRQNLGGSYLDYFFLFQSFGVWGLAVLMRILEEIHIELGVPQPTIGVIILFMPGLHFWTSAIGKDAPLFFAVSLAVWSAMRMRSRAHFFALAIGVMTLFRPHIALISIAALSTATLLDRRASPLAKFGLLVVALMAGVFIVGTLRGAIGVDLSSGSALGAVAERSDEIARRSAGATMVLNAPYVWRLFSLLFRPLFIDAPGVMGILASFENLLFIYIIGSVVWFWGETRKIAKTVFFLRFALIFVVMLAALLALVYYNVGLGLRQKMMLVPPLLSLFAAHYTLHRLWRIERHQASLGYRRQRASRPRRLPQPSGRERLGPKPS